MNSRNSNRANRTLEECSSVVRNKTGGEVRGMTVSGHVECGEDWISLDFRKPSKGFEQGSDIYLNLSMITQSAGFCNMKMVSATSKSSKGISTGEKCYI